VFRTTVVADLGGRRESFGQSVTARYDIRAYSVTTTRASGSRTERIARGGRLYVRQLAPQTSAWAALPAPAQDVADGGTLASIAAPVSANAVAALRGARDETTVGTTSRWMACRSLITG